MQPECPSAVGVIGVTVHDEIPDFAPLVFFKVSFAVSRGACYDGHSLERHRKHTEHEW